MASQSAGLGEYVAQGTTPVARARRMLAIFVMTAGGCFTGLMTTALSPSMVAIKAHFGHDASAALVAQLVVTTASLGVVIGGPVAGWLIQRFGIRAVLLGALPCYGLCGSAGLLLESATALFASRFGLGFCAATIFTASVTLLGDSFVGGGRSRVLGFKTTVAAGFAVLSVMLSARIAEAAGWRAPFALYGATALAMMLIVLFAVEARPREQARAVAAPAMRGLLILWPVYAILIAISAITILQQTQVPLLLASDHDAPPTTIGWVIAGGTVAYTIASIFYGSLHVRLGPRRMFALNLALIGSGVSVLGLSHDLLLSAAGCLLLGSGGGLMQPYLLNVLLDRTAAETRGRAIGLVSPAINSGQFLSPLLFFLLFAGLGGHGAFLTIGIVLFLSALAGLRSGVPAVRAAPAT
ncbi:major facilitator superfamily MFS_1 [Rhizorhabdus wittichii RW1]|uniref:Major facilitator superfamily MFS_1 n=1 Tax=Rhizorhabdus wittichii (strain DSM 6014 / CCUG 31198 / JCM 15750 / NBRC 105917 / EY 4224 / RW1) TaxID=392499 RepID=A0A9J9LDS4_RHIWR|nr:major facilitator superfamily MFS_1 [Rhizorhabdus wittichii RW1]